MPPFNICDFVGFILVTWCATNSNQTPGELRANSNNLPVLAASSSDPNPVQVPLQKRYSDKFELDYQWSYINFTWPSADEYETALSTGKYVPEHNVMAGIKHYQDRMYIALPRLRAGSPVTLAYVPTGPGVQKTNPLLTPFPSWGMNAQPNCGTLQNVQSMEIDKNGIMWILDGVRINQFTTCSPKIVLVDLKNRGKVLQTYNVPNDICLHEGGFLNDLVIDDSDPSGDEYAYITDNSSQDPGLIVYSRKRNTAWKLRDRTMFADVAAANFTVDNVPNINMVPLDGITLSPHPENKADDRVVYYCALSSLELYAISTRILRNEPFAKTDLWRRYIKHVGTKEAQTDGMMMDNKGNLYYGLLTEDAVSKWNIFESFTTAKQIDRKLGGMIWPDSFAMDKHGFLYVVCNGINKFFSPIYPLSITNEIKFRIYKLYTGTKSYLFN